MSHLEAQFTGGPNPPRRFDQQEERQAEAGIDDTPANPDDPPPAYEAQPSRTGEHSLEFGPARPFQPPPGPPPALPQRRYPEPNHPPPLQQSHTNNSLPSSLPPPNFPFWNGPNLTPQQTGFAEHGYGAGGYHPPPPPNQVQPVLTSNNPYAPPPGPPPTHLSPVHTGASSTPPAPSVPQTYAPTTTPTPGQPLLRNGKLLVYPIGHFCQKCGNTGYKFNDPSHPCRKDWDKYSKPYNDLLRLAPNTTPAPNFQKPLRIFTPPTASSTNYIPTPPSMYGSSPPVRAQVNYRAPQLHYGAPPPGPDVLVVRPGDPRIGGLLCRECGGRGLVVPMFSFFGDEETCLACRGAGRVFR